MDNLFKQVIEFYDNKILSKERTVIEILEVELPGSLEYFKPLDSLEVPKSNNSSIKKMSHGLVGENDTMILNDLLMKVLNGVFKLSENVRMIFDKYQEQITVDLSEELESYIIQDKEIMKDSYSTNYDKSEDDIVAFLADSKDTLSQDDQLFFVNTFLECQLEINNFKRVMKHHIREVNSKIFKHNVADWVVCMNKLEEMSSQYKALFVKFTSLKPKVADIYYSQSSKKKMYDKAWEKFVSFEKVSLTALSAFNSIYSNDILLDLQVNVFMSKINDVERLKEIIEMKDLSKISPDAVFDEIGLTETILAYKNHTNGLTELELEIPVLSSVKSLLNANESNEDKLHGIISMIDFFRGLSIVIEEFKYFLSDKHTEVYNSSKLSKMDSHKKGSEIFHHDTYYMLSKQKDITEKLNLLVPVLSEIMSFALSSLYVVYSLEEKYVKQFLDLETNDYDLKISIKQTYVHRKRVKTVSKDTVKKPVRGMKSQRNKTNRSGESLYPNLIDIDESSSTMPEGKTSTMPEGKIERSRLVMPTYKPKILLRKSAAGRILDYLVGSYNGIRSYIKPKEIIPIQFLIAPQTYYKDSFNEPSENLSKNEKEHYNLLRKAYADMFNIISINNFLNNSPESAIKIKKEKKEFNPNPEEVELTGRKLTEISNLFVTFKETHYGIINGLRESSNLNRQREECLEKFLNRTREDVTKYQLLAPLFMGAIKATIPLFYSFSPSTFANFAYHTAGMSANYVRNNKGNGRSYEQILVDEVVKIHDELKKSVFEIEVDNSKIFSIPEKTMKWNNLVNRIKKFKIDVNNGTRFISGLKIYDEDNETFKEYDTIIRDGPYKENIPLESTVNLDKQEMDNVLKLETIGKLLLDNLKKFNLLSHKEELLQLTNIKFENYELFYNSLNYGSRKGFISLIINSRCIKLLNILCVVKLRSSATFDGIAEHSTRDNLKPRITSSTKIRGIKIDDVIENLQELGVATHEYVDFVKIGEPMVTGLNLEKKLLFDYNKYSIEIYRSLSEDDEFKGINDETKQDKIKKLNSALNDLRPSLYRIERYKTDLNNLIRSDTNKLFKIHGVKEHTEENSGLFSFLKRSLKYNFTLNSILQISYFLMTAINFMKPPSNIMAGGFFREKSGPKVKTVRSRPPGTKDSKYLGGANKTNAKEILRIHQTFNNCVNELSKLYQSFLGYVSSEETTIKHLEYCKTDKEIKELSKQVFSDKTSAADALEQVSEQEEEDLSKNVRIKSSDRWGNRCLNGHNFVEDRRRRMRRRRRRRRRRRDRELGYDRPWIHRPFRRPGIINRIVRRLTRGKIENPVKLKHEKMANLKHKEHGKKQQSSKKKETTEIHKVWIRYSKKLGKFILRNHSKEYFKSISRSKTYEFKGYNIPLEYPFLMTVFDVFGKRKRITPDSLIKGNESFILSGSVLKNYTDSSEIQYSCPLDESVHGYLHLTN